MARPVNALLIVAVIATGAAAYVHHTRGRLSPRVSSLPVSSGDIVEVVSATGTIGATRTVEVGTLVSGTVSHLHADFNSIVHQGEVIAELDRAPFEIQLHAAEAAAEKARADRGGDQATLEFDAQSQERTDALLASGLASPQDVDAARALTAQDRAQVHEDDDAVRIADVGVEEAAVNLERCRITSPIDGVVVERDVDEGETVAAAAAAPKLFVIATELGTLEVVGNIDEADVSKVRPGQSASFTVESYPTENFPATVTEVRLNPSVSSDVVTYQAIFRVPNDDLRLRPGMTANLKIRTAEVEDVLRVPNAALKLRPTREVFAAFHEPPPDVTGTPPSVTSGSIRAAGAADATRTQATGAGTIIDRLFAPRPSFTTSGQVWILDQGRLEPIPVTLGISDGTWTELAAGDLRAGEEVVTNIVIDAG